MSLLWRHRRPTGSHLSEPVVAPALSQSLPPVEAPKPQGEPAQANEPKKRSKKS